MSSILEKAAGIPKENMASNSSISGLGIFEKIREWSHLFFLRFQGLLKRDDFLWLWENILEYEQGFLNFTGKELKNAKLLEVGYGARPYRLLTLLSMGMDVRGVDLDAPMLRGAPGEFLRILRKNGLQRLVKSFVRFFLFDWKQRSDLRRELKKRGVALRIPSANGNEFIVENASSVEMDRQISKASLDFVYSEDVFEHIPAESLPKLVENIAAWLKPQGVAFIRPNIFTGITGGAPC